MSTPSPQQTATKTACFFGIFISLLGILILAPIFAEGFHSHAILQLCFMSLLVSLSYAVYSKKWAAFISGAIIISFITFDAISLIYHSIEFMIAAYVVFDLFLLFAIILLLKDVLLAKQIDTNLIYGAIIAYILIGILWGKLYFLNELFFPQSFHGLSQNLHRVGVLGINFDTQFDLLYYSFTTLATLGLGDITPVHHFSKTLTVLEAIFGQLFIAIGIAKLVSAWHLKNAIKMNTPD